MPNLSFLSKDIVKDLGLDKLTPSEQEKMLLQIGDIIFKRIMMRVVEELDEATKNDFDKLLDSPNKDQNTILNFLQERLPGYDSLIAEEVSGFKKEAVDLMKGAKTA